MTGEDDIHNRSGEGYHTSPTKTGLTRNEINHNEIDIDLENRQITGLDRTNLEYDENDLPFSLKSDNLGKMRNRNSRNSFKMETVREHSTSINKTDDQLNFRSAVTKREKMIV